MTIFKKLDKNNPEDREKVKKFFRVLGWIFFLPIMFTALIWKKKDMNKIGRRVLLAIGIWFSLVNVVFWGAMLFAPHTPLTQEQIEANKKVAAEKKAVKEEEKRKKAELAKLSNEEKKKKEEEEKAAKLAADKATLEKKNQEEKAAKEKKVAEEKLAAEVKANQKYVDKIVNATSMTQTQALDVLNVLKSVGITTVDSIENKMDMGNGGFGYTVNSRIAIILINNKAENISILGRGITLCDSGTVKAQASDYILPDIEVQQYISQAQECVKRVMKAPSTAAFPGTILHLDQYSISKYKDIITVSSYVDGQNSFGAMIRSNWTVQMNLTQQKFTYVKLGDQSTGTYTKVQ